MRINMFSTKWYKKALTVIHKIESKILQSDVYIFNKIANLAAFLSNKPKHKETCYVKIYNQHGECIFDSRHNNDNPYV